MPRKPLARVPREARDLAPGVDPRVGAAGDREGDRSPQDRLQGSLELCLNRAQPGLRRPAAEVGAVVFDVEPGRGQCAISPTSRRAEA